MAAAAEGRPGTYRVLLIGKTGNGKSALGNTLLGKDDAFVSMPSMSSTTKTCSMERGKIDGQDIEVIDTPGLTDKFVRDEISKCLGALSPGPHAVFMVCSGNNRFTEEDYEAYVKTRQLLEDNDKKLTSFMVVAFTGLDELEKNNKTPAKEVEAGSEYLHKMLKEVNSRYIFVDNATREHQKMAEQRSKLLGSIQSVVDDNRGQYFTNDLQKVINKNIDDAATEKAKETGMSEDEAREKIKVSISTGDGQTLQLVVNGTKKVEQQAKKKGVCVVL